MLDFRLDFPLVSVYPPSLVERVRRATLVRALRAEEEALEKRDKPLNSK